MWILVLGILLGWLASMWYYNAQAQQTDEDNHGGLVVAIVLLVILMGFLFGAIDADNKATKAANATATAEAARPAPTATFQRR